MSVFLLFLEIYEKIYLYNYRDKTYMPENFSIHNPIEEPESIKFQEDSVWPIKLDGTLSAEEINQCNEHFSENCKSVNDETGGKLWDFLRSDVIPNMDSSWLDPHVQEKINFLSLTHPEAIGRPILSIEDQEVLSVFGISEEDFIVTQESLSPFDMQFIDKLRSYQTYINQELWLPNGSSLNQGEHANIISNLLSTIWDNINQIPDLVSQERERYESLGNNEVIWIINDAIEWSFEETKTKLLPNIKLFLASTAPWFYENSEDIFYARWLEWNFRPEELEIRSEHAQQSFRNEVSELWELLIAWKLNDIPDVYNWWWNIWEQFEESIWLQNWLSEISQSSFLSPEDAERYKSAKIRASIFMVMQMIPGLDILGMWIDAFDAFNRTDQSFETLKWLWVIDNDIHVWKAGWEMLLSGIWAIGWIVSLDIATKWSRVMRVLESAGITKWDLLSEVDNFSSDLWLPEWTGYTIKRTLSWFWSGRANVTFMKTARSNGRLSDTPWSETMEIAGELITLSSREKAFLERLQNAYELGEIPFSIENLDISAITRLTSVLNQMHEMHGSVRVWEHSFSQIKDKMRIAQENDIPTYIAKIAIFEWFAWVSDNYAEVLKVLNHREASRLSAEQIFEKIWTELPDTVDLFDLEEALWIWDQKLIEFIQSKIPRGLDESSVAKSDIISLIRAHENADIFNFLTADITSIINKLRDAWVNLEIWNQRILMDFINIFKERPEMDLTSFMIAKNMFRDTDISPTELSNMLAQISGVGKWTILRMIPQARRQAQKWHEWFAQYLAGRNWDDFDLADIQAYLDSQSEIKTFNLSVGEESFEYFSGSNLKARQIWERFRQILQQQGWNELYISRNL